MRNDFHFRERIGISNRALRRMLIEKTIEAPVQIHPHGSRYESTVLLLPAKAE